MDIATLFKTMMKGVIISRNSKKYGEMALFLLDDENYTKYELILQELGYELNGNNGYFYISQTQSLNSEELDRFVTSHKEAFMLIAILKQLMPYARSNSIIKYTEFIFEFEQKKDDLILEKWNYIFKNDDLKSSSEKFFERLQKEFIVEKVEKGDDDSYRVLNAIDYYLSFLESVV